MPESPASPTPYEILGVAASASQAELRRAYRRLLRESHPDTGGSPARFHAVQQAWKRIGESGARKAWDLADHTGDASRPAQARPAGARPPGASAEGSSVRARSYGHPGGQARERYLTMVREWAGRGADLPDPYDPALVRSAPREIRHQLADALAEEATARAVSSLGIGYTIWNGVRAKTGRIDHIVLGPAGLFAIMSEDWGSEVRVVRGELTAEGIAPPDQPARTLVRATRALGRELRVRFTTTLIVVSDDALAAPIILLGRKDDSAVVQLSAVPRVLRDGLSGGDRLSIEDVFDVRTRVQQGVRFV